MSTQRSGRPAVGTELAVPGYGRCTVESNNDPSVILFRTESGSTFKIGEQALRLALLAAEGEDVRPTT